MDAMREALARRAQRYEAVEVAMMADDVRDAAIMDGLTNAPSGDARQYFAAWIGVSFCDEMAATRQHDGDMRTAGRALANRRPPIEVLDISTAEQRRASRADTVGHSGVQPWSAGPLFPAIITRVERYAVPPNWIEWSMLHEVEGTGRDYRGRTYEEHLAAFMGLPLEERLECVSYLLTIGAFCAEYATREDAEKVARWAVRDGRVMPRQYASLMGDGERATRNMPRVG